MEAVISTAPDRCRRCYSCVRRCPAKAIRVQGGQAAVIPERCIGCGRCVGACSQGAKRIRDNLPLAEQMMRRGHAVAMLAPSFAAAFPEWAPLQTVTALRRCGFEAVCEVAFGADLVAREYQHRNRQQPCITTACPAVVTYIRKYTPELVPFLSPVLSPMAAMGKALKKRIRPGCSTVFIGPCTAKMLEAQAPDVAPWVDVVVTFNDIRRLFDEKGIHPELLSCEEFDPPLSTLGALFPLPGGLVRVAGLPNDLLDDDCHSVTGMDEFIDAMTRLRARVVNGHLGVVQGRLFDALFCKGCFGGPAMPKDESPMRSKDRIVDFIRTRTLDRRAGQAAAELDALSDLDLSRSFEPDDQRLPPPTEEQIREILARTNKHGPEDELDCRACGYRSCRDKAIAVYHGVAELEMCLPFIIEQLVATVDELHRSHDELTETQAQLVRSERLASMGQLAAGIAHEVNNPLGTVLIYAHLLADSLKAETLSDPAQLRDDAGMILQEATRCKSIVGGLLDFARQNKVNRAPADLCGLVDDALHICKAQLGQSPILLDNLTEAGLPLANVDREQMLQVLLNLVRNACEAMPEGGRVQVRAQWLDQQGEFRIAVRDTGPGIAPEHVPKLFTPFFTTKSVGKGTGLGLPICYGIVKMHRGSIAARGNSDGPGTTFEITLPGPMGATETSGSHQILPFSEEDA